VLSVSSSEKDHSALQNLFIHPRWMIVKAPNSSIARQLLQQHDISVVICDCDSTPGEWTDLLNHSQSLKKPPSVIVTSRIADDRLWAEALNLGAWDVLSKPFDRSELLRGVRYAWEHWERQSRPTGTAQAMRAAG
jgi:DNA-binding NtrC family response regulator